jgi:hypothetical protein
MSLMKSISTETTQSKAHSRVGTIDLFQQPVTVESTVTVIDDAVIFEALTTTVCGHCKHRQRFLDIGPLQKRNNITTRVGKFLPVRGKTVPAKMVFAGRKKPPGKNPAKLVLQTFARWKK